MTYYINRASARAKARQDLTIFREINYIMEQILTDANNGKYQTVVDDGTAMTESTPDVTVTGTVANPTITGTPTIVLNGTTITLGTTGTNLNSIIADINDAGLTGIVASKSTTDNLVITYTTLQSTSWDLNIGTGTADAALGLTSASVATAVNPDSVSFYTVWDGSTSDRAKTDQMQQVVKYFENLGYSVDQQVNANTNKTFKWVISY
jgi:hypothetical protein